MACIEIFLSNLYVTPVLIPNYQFRSKSIIAYNRYESDGRFIRTERQRISAANLKDEGTYTGVLCPGAKKRLTKCIEQLIQFSKPKTVLHEGKNVKFSVNFITLTIYSPGKFVPGADAHKNLLEPFLKWVRDNNPGFTYLWKAELQAKREDVPQLHYHLTTNTYLHKDAIRNKWNELQIRAGYLDMNAFYAEFGHNFVPSTKVHALYKKRDPVAYIKKEILNYSDFIEHNIQAEVDETRRNFPDMPEKDIIAEVTKGIQNLYTVGGKVWDCSLNLKRGSLFTYEPESYADEVVDNLEREIGADRVTAITTDHCTIYKFKRGNTWGILPRKQRQEYFKKGDDLMNFKREAPKPKLKPDIPPDIVPRKINFYVDLTLFGNS